MGDAVCSSLTVFLFHSHAVSFRIFTVLQFVTFISDSLRFKILQRCLTFRRKSATTYHFLHLLTLELMILEIATFFLCLSCGHALVTTQNHWMVPRLPCSAHNFLSVFLVLKVILLYQGNHLSWGQREEQVIITQIQGMFLTDVGRSETKIHRNTGTSLAESIFNRMKKNEENSNI